MVSTSKGRNVDRRTSVFHHLVLGSMREETIGNFKIMVLGRDNFVGGRFWEPSILLYMNLFPISHSPLVPRLMTSKLL